MPFSRRLVFVGAAVVDVTAWIPAFPVPGGDIVAGAAALTPGGGFNVMSAAARHGMAVLFAGRHGAGPAGEAVRAALAAEGIEVLRPVDPTADTGFVVTMVEPDGERTFVTSPLAQLALGAGALGTVPVQSGDVVYVSGYGLATEHGAEVSSWVGALDAGVTVVADPGPLVAELPRDLLDEVRARSNWWSCNRREAAALTGIDDPVGAGVALIASSGSEGRYAGGVVVRDGAGGCVVVRPAASGPVVDHIAAPPVEAIDTTGAGDTHVGVFVAMLGDGRDVLDAARRATTAASISVTRRGPATAPGRQELDRWIADQRRTM